MHGNKTLHFPLSNNHAIYILDGKSNIIKYTTSHFSEIVFRYQTFISPNPESLSCILCAVRVVNRRVLSQMTRTRVAFPFTSTAPSPSRSLIDKVKYSSKTRWILQLILFFFNSLVPLIPVLFWTMLCFLCCFPVNRYN